jgi:uncharacterized protein (DUF849 family)
MTVGMAGVAGTILAAYASMGIRIDYLLAAAFMSAPGGILMAKIMMPDAPPVVTAEGDPALANPHPNDEPEMAHDDEEEKPANIIMAAAQGAQTGVKLAVAVGAMVLAFVALVALANGILGGIGPHPEDVVHMRRTADRLFGNDYQWSILGAGKGQIALASIGAAMGSNVRVGLEDSLWIGPGKLAESSAQQVQRIRTVLEALNLEIATPDEARSMLALKGGDRVNF